jgi:hypothetical protein
VEQRQSSPLIELRRTELFIFVGESLLFGAGMMAVVMIFGSRTDVLGPSSWLGIGTAVLVLAVAPAVSVLTRISFDYELSLTRVLITAALAGILSAGFHALLG